MKNGSGWILETIDYLHLFTAEYTPIHGNSYIPTPQAIVDKKAIINPENQNENCIKYCIAASQHHHQMDKKHLDRSSQYEQYFKNFNFEGCSIPMEIDDFTKFEKNNNMAINVYHIKHDGKLISPLRITQRDVRPEEYVNLLLIEGEEHCHYTWIKNFDRLLSYGDNHTRQFCPFCCHGFDVRYNKSLEEHLPLCRTKGGQKTIIPPKGKNIVEFKDQHKCLKHPVVIYADFEAINKKIINHEVDQENSKTINKTEHICSGYSYTVVSPFFENRVKTYRGEDAGKHFIETVLKEEIIISKWLKEMEKKEHNLTADEEKQWQAETKCHICSDKFLKGCIPHSAKEEHLKHIEHYLLTNKLDITKIPSLKLVKKQKRIISLQLHPDKQGDVSEREKLLKQEELKKFNVENENLQNYLIDNELIEETEQDEEFELEDELSKEDSGLRGGISMVCDAFARANNKYLKEYYDPGSLQSFLMFVDANNLYGWAMSQMLPTGGFKWISLSKGLKRPEETESIGRYRTMSEWTDDILRLDEEDSIGYIFQVDLEYPDNLRSDETHDNFPLAPESLKIEKDMLSTYQQNLGDQLGVKYGGEKLCLTLNDKTQYICHARNLKFYLKHGLKFKKIHKILKFEQSQWLKPYIDLNTKLRQEADNKFEEGFAKLMNNSFFGEYTYFIM